MCSSSALLESAARGTPKFTSGNTHLPVYGNVIVGPTLEFVKDRKPLPMSADTIQQLTAFAEGIIPDLKNYRPVGSIVGLRPGTYQRDYIIEAVPDK